MINDHIFKNVSYPKITAKEKQKEKKRKNYICAYQLAFDQDLVMGITITAHHS